MAYYDDVMVFVMYGGTIENCNYGVYCFNNMAVAFGISGSANIVNNTNGVYFETWSGDVDSYGYGRIDLLGDYTGEASLSLNSSYYRVIGYKLGLNNGFSGADKFKIDNYPSLAISDSGKFLVVDSVPILITTLEQLTDLCTNGGKGELGANITNDTSTITIPEGKFVTLDLKTYTVGSTNLPRHSTFTVKGTLNIYGDTGKIVGDASYGGAISMSTDNAIVNMYSGTISASAEYNGGGVYLNRGTFNMYGGSISNCRINYNSSNSNSGAGVYIINGKFNMYGGSITNNKLQKAGYFGAGVCIYYSTSGELNLSGSAVIKDNTDYYNSKSNIYINSGKISVIGDLTDGADIRMSYPTPVNGNVIGTNTGRFTGVNHITNDSQTLVGVLSGTDIIWADIITTLTQLTNLCTNGGGGKLGANISGVNVTIPAGKSIVLDMGSYTLSGSGNIITNNGVFSTNGGTIIGSGGGGGKSAVRIKTPDGWKEAKVVSVKTTEGWKSA